MPTASWILATHERPELLALSLRHLARQEVLPRGWQREVVVATSPGDPGAHIAEGMGARVVLTQSTRLAPRLNAALDAAAGELVLVTGDDDFQDPARGWVTALDYERGADVVGLSAFHFLDLHSGELARWDGGGPLRAGMAVSYRRSVLEQIGGWRDVAYVDHDLAARLPSGLSVVDEASLLSRDTLFTHGLGTTSGARPFPAQGASERFGAFRVTGLGLATSPLALEILTQCGQARDHVSHA